MAGPDLGDQEAAAPAGLVSTGGGPAGNGPAGNGPAGNGPAGNGPAGDGPADTPSVDRRLLDEIFGDVLPDTTADERDPSGDAGYSEQWYRENRPPHHGG